MFLKLAKTKNIQFIATLLLIIGVIIIHSNISVFAAPEKTAGQLSMDPEFHPQAGSYHYQVKWNKVNVGSARISINQEEDLYKIVLHAETNRTIDKVYKVRYRGESSISADPLAPLEAKINEKVKSSRKETVIEFHENGTIKATETKSRKGKPDKTTEREIRTESFTLDPFSATFLVRRLDWEEGVAEVFDVFTGEDQYLLELKCLQKTTIEIAGEKREAWEIIPELTNLDPDERKKDDKQMNDMWIYVSADDAREMLKIKVALKIGYFRIILEKFEPADGAAQQTLPR